MLIQKKISPLPKSHQTRLTKIREYLDKDFKNISINFIKLKKESEKARYFPEIALEWDSPEMKETDRKLEDLGNYVASLLKSENLI